MEFTESASSGAIAAESTPAYSFTPLEPVPYECKSLSSSRERKDQVMQYNLDTGLKVVKFRFSGAPSANNDFDQLLTDFFSSSTVQNTIGLNGAAATPMNISKRQVNTGVMSMEFFDRLDEAGAAICE